VKDVLSTLSLPLCQRMIKAHPSPRFSGWSSARWTQHATASACRWVLPGMARQQGLCHGGSAKHSNVHTGPMQILAQTSMSLYRDRHF